MSPAAGKPLTMPIVWTVLAVGLVAVWKPSESAGTAVPTEPLPTPQYPTEPVPTPQYPTEPVPTPRYPTEPVPTPWYPTAAPSACLGQVSCIGCTSDGDCGWAADLALCLPGTASGPNPPYTSSQWDWYSSQCPLPTSAPSAVGCGNFTGCQSCLEVASCGWAADWGACLPGVVAGPTNNYSNVWMWATCDIPTIPPFGSVHWSTANPPSSVSYQVLGGAVTAGVIAHWDECFGCAGAADGVIVGLDASTGAARWRYNTSAQYVWFSGKNGQFIAVSQQSIAALRATDGHLLWNVTLAHLAAGFPVGGVLPPAWVGDDGLVISITFFNLTDQTVVLWLNAIDGHCRVLWNSCVLNQPWIYPAHAPSVGFATDAFGRRIAVVAQMFESLFFLVVNVTHPEAAAIGNWSGIMTWSEYVTGSSLTLVDDRIVLFGSDPADGTVGRVVSFALDAKLRSVASFASMGNLLTVVPHRKRGDHSPESRFRFAMLTIDADDVCVVVSAEEGSVVRSTLKLRAACSIATQTEESLYIIDSSGALYRYDLSPGTLSWVTASLGRSQGSTSLMAPRARVFGNNLFAMYNQPLNGSQYFGSFAAQIDIDTGKAVAVFPASWFPQAHNDVFYNDPSRDEVFAIVTSYPFNALVLSLVPHTKGSMLPLLGAIRPTLAVGQVGLQYYVCPSSVTCVSTKNQSIVWLAVASDEYYFKQLLVVGSNVVAFSYPYWDAAFLSIFDAKNGTMKTSLPLPTSLPNCAFGGSSMLPTTEPLASGQSPIWALNNSVYYMTNAGCIVGISAETGAATSWSLGGGQDYANIMKAYAYDQRFLYYTTSSTFSPRLHAIPWSAFTGYDLTERSVASSSNQLVLTPNGLITVETHGWTEYSTPRLHRLLDVSSPTSWNSLSAPPFILGTNIFVVAHNSSVLSYSIVSLTITPILRFIATPPMIFSSSNLGTPVAAPWGLLVYANSNGILCIDSKTGAIPYAITQDVAGTSLNCQNPVAYGGGLIFIMCNEALQMVDVVVGRIWRSCLSGATQVTVDATDERAIVLTQATGPFVSITTLTDAPYDSRNISRRPPRYSSSESARSVVSEYRTETRGRRPRAVLLRTNWLLSTFALLSAALVVAVASTALLFGLRRRGEPKLGAMELQRASDDSTRPGVVVLTS